MNLHRGRILFFILLTLWLTPSAPARAADQADLAVSKAMLEAAKPSRCLTDAEAELASLVNKLREAHDLPPVPVTEPLYLVAKWHVIDLATNSPHRDKTDDRGGACNLHSWSDKGKETGGGWEPLCYTPDHKQALGMWRKPREISGQRSNGYENIYWTSAPLSPAMAVNYWEGKTDESDMMLQRGAWKKHPWRAMGVGIFGNYAAVWFSEKSSGAADMDRCAPVTK